MADRLLAKLAWSSLTFTILALVTPAYSKNATAADFFPICTNLSETGANKLVVDPSRKTGSYSDINAAIRDSKPGDTIELMSGNYGTLVLTGINSRFISIVAGQGQTPQFRKIAIGGSKPASHWRLSGLTVSGMSPPSNGKWTHDKLILVLDSDNIILDNNKIFSADANMDWAPEDPGAPVMDAPSDGISARQSHCITIADNKLKNIFNGIDFGGDQAGDRGKYYLVSGNSISDFAGDGIDHFASHSRIMHNRIVDGHDICHHICIHNDGIQGWNYNNSSASVNSDVVIDGNQIIAQITPNLVLPVIGLQGITIFNTRWDGVRITNNLVLTNTWHGISIYGVNNAAIINNTVAPTDPRYLIWIMVNNSKSDPPGFSYNVVVRNNVVPRVTGTPNIGVIADHNLFLKTAREFSDAFVKFDPTNFTYDLHPSKGSPVIGKGTPESGPTADIEGRLRQGSSDIGAYIYSKR